MKKHMKSSVRNNDPRETLAHQLAEAGLNSKDAFIIALDSGLNVVNNIVKMDLQLNGLMDLNSGIEMVNYIAKMALRLNMLMDLNTGG